MAYLSQWMHLPNLDLVGEVHVGIQNSGLGLVLIFNFFGGLGGMALVAAFWGIWHIVSGLIIATFWSRRTPEEISVAPNEGVSA